MGLSSSTFNMSGQKATSSSMQVLMLVTNLGKHRLRVLAVCVWRSLLQSPKLLLHAPTHKRTRSHAHPRPHAHAPKHPSTHTRARTRTDTHKHTQKNVPTCSSFGPQYPATPCQAQLWDQHSRLRELPSPLTFINEQ